MPEMDWHNDNDGKYPNKSYPRLHEMGWEKMVYTQIHSFYPALEYNVDQQSLVLSSLKKY